MKGKVHKGRVLVKEQVLKEKTVNGIIIPVAEQKQLKGEIVIGGEQVKVGDTIYYAPEKGVKIVIEEEKFLLLGESDVLYIE